MNLLLEDGDRLLDEGSDGFLLEDGAVAAPEPALSGRVQFPPLPRLRNTGRTVRITATASLGTLTAHLNTRVEFADEELLELL